MPFTRSFCRGSTLCPLFAIAGACALSPPLTGQAAAQPNVLVMERISVSGQGVVEKGRFSELPWITPDGRYVVFTTAANTLDRAPDEIAQLGLPFTGPDSSQNDVYLVDRWLPATDEARVRRLSRREFTNGSPNRGSSFGVINDDATIAFLQSKASNLDPDESDEGILNLRKIFMVDLVTGAITLVTKHGSRQQRTGRNPAVSGDGRFVYFSSQSSSVPSPAGGVFSSGADTDLFRFDSALGTFALVTPTSNRTDLLPAVSSDGRWAAFASETDADLLTGDPSFSEGAATCDSDIYLVDMGPIDPVPAQREPAPNLDNSGIFSGDASASNADVTTGPAAIVPVSLSVTPNTMGAAGNALPAISPDGRYVAFVSWADDLIAGDALGNPDTFVRDMGVPPTSNTGPSVRVSVGGSAASGAIVKNDAENGCSWGCRPSVAHVPTDGVNPGMVVVAYVTLAGFDPVDTNDAWDVYLRVMREDDLGCWNTYLVSAPAPDPTTGQRSPGDMASFNPSLRAERDPLDASMLLVRIAFESYSTNLDPATVDNNVARDIYYTELSVPVPACP